MLATYIISLGPSQFLRPEEVDKSVLFPFICDAVLCGILFASRPPAILKLSNAAFMCDRNVHSIAAGLCSCVCCLPRVALDLCYQQHRRFPHDLHVYMFVCICIDQFTGMQKTC